MNDISIIGRKPVSVWNRSLKVNFKDLFKSLGKAFIDGIMGNWGGVGKDVVDASVALNIQTNTIEEAAWLLIYRSVSHAMFDLIYDSRELLILKDNEKENNQDQKLDKILNKLDFEKDLEEYELEIKGNFFSYPQQLSILAPLEKIFSTYLKNFLEDDIQAKSIASRLPIYFVDALAEEWRRNLPKYEVLEKQLSTPFDKAKAREFEWYQYRIRLQKKVEEPMFSEAFGLSKVYIPLRAYYWRKTNQFSEDELENITRERREKEKEAVVIDLEKELNDWLNQADQYDTMRIISGGPGSGKSSFVKMFAANLAANGNLRTLFIPLHLFDPKDDLINAVQTFIKGDELLNTNPLSLDELNEQKLLIIFDGLDELASQGEIAKEIAQKFIEEVQNKTNQLNRNRLLLQVIISGRELIIQDNSSKFRKEKQILNLLPYFVTDEEKRNKTFVDDDNLLEQDQRQDWWLKYSRVSGYQFQSLPSELDQGKLIEITSQPLLNYLVALSYVGQRIEFSEDSSLNIIYEDLLKAVYKRGWEKSQIYKPIKDITEENFRRILEEIGLAARHGDGRTTTVEEIYKHCEQANLKRLFDSFQQGAEQGITRLLMAFYFRQSGVRNDKKTFEFTHKSFGEYLAARRIIRGVKLISKKLQQREEDYDEGWDKKEALTYWAKICGPTRTDRYLLPFILDEIRLNDNKSEVEKWQKTFSSLIAFMLRQGMPMEKLDPRPNFHQANLQAINAEEALLVIVSGCASVTQERSDINWPSRDSFGAWLARLQGQRTGNENSIAFDCLHDLTLKNAILIVRDLYRANLIRADLSRAYLSGADLIRADLSRADLIRADLSGADLSRAYLSGADLIRADLSRADLSGADLIRADLIRANLSGANLIRANLSGADLSGANLIRANLIRANLSGANLSGAKLTHEQIKSAHDWQKAIYVAATWDQREEKWVVKDEGANNAKIAEIRGEG